MTSPTDKGKTNRNTIVSIVEKNQPIRSKDLYEKAMKNNRMSNATVYKHLKKLIEENILKRTPERHKEVYYELTEEGDVAIKREEMMEEMIKQFKNIKDYEKQREFLEKLMDA